MWSVGRDKSARFRHGEFVLSGTFPPELRGLVPAYCTHSSRREKPGFSEKPGFFFALDPAHGASSNRLGAFR